MLLVRTRVKEPIAQQLASELWASGSSVVESGPSGRTTRAPLRELANAERAAAAIRVTPNRTQIEIWTGVSAEGTLDVIDIPRPIPPARVLALRAAEVLRARGLTIDLVDDAKVPPNAAGEATGRAPGPVRTAESATERSPTRGEPQPNQTVTETEADEAEADTETEARVETEAETEADDAVAEADADEAEPEGDEIEIESEPEIPVAPAALQRGRKQIRIPLP